MEDQITKGLLDFRDLKYLEIEEKKVFLSPWIVEKSITLISGWRGVGKTFFAMSLVNAISKGSHVGPWKAQTSVPCLYLDGEMPIQDMQERASEIGLYEDGKNPAKLYSCDYAFDLGTPRANLWDKKWQQAMREMITENGFKVWVIDNIGSVCPGDIDENSKKDWDPVNHWLLSLRFSGISTILLHHTGKAGGQRGTSGHEDNVDTSIILKKPDDYETEDGCRFICKFTKNRVRAKNRALIADMEFKYSEGQFQFEQAKAKNRIEILKMLDQGGITQKEIAENLGVTEAHVSKIKTAAIKEGYLTPKNKLTPSGFNEIHIAN